MICISDICKCLEAKDCVHKDICYRSTASEGMYQSYSYFMTEGKCNEENNYPYLWRRSYELREKLRNEESYGNREK